MIGQNESSEESGGGILSKLSQLRNWVASSRPRAYQTARPAEKFVEALAQEILRVLDYEMFTPPGGGPIIPHEFNVFLSSEDDHAWRGGKRKALQQALTTTLQQRSVQLFKGRPPQNPSFTIELLIDDTLTPGQFRVQAIWSGNPSGKGASENLDEPTLVRPALGAVLYALEVWRDGKREAIVPVTKKDFTVGRGSLTVPVDLRLHGANEMSRLHLLFSQDASGRVWVTRQGQAPVTIDGVGVLRGDQGLITPQAIIQTCGYALKLNAG